MGGYKLPQAGIIEVVATTDVEVQANLTGAWRSTVPQRAARATIATVIGSGHLATTGGGFRRGRIARLGGLGAGIGPGFPELAAVIGMDDVGRRARRRPDWGLHLSGLSAALARLITTRSTASVPIPIATTVIATRTPVITTPPVLVTSWSPIIARTTILTNITAVAPATRSFGAENSTFRARGWRFRSWGRSFGTQYGCFGSRCGCFGSGRGCFGSGGWNLWARRGCFGSRRSNFWTAHGRGPGRTTGVITRTAIVFTRAAIVLTRGPPFGRARRSLPTALWRMSGTRGTVV